MQLACRASSVLSSWLLSQGVYVWKDLPITWDVPKVPVMPCGFYRGVVHGGLHGREHLKPGLCLKGEVHLVPRV